MRKLLIVGGCSWSNPNEECYHVAGIDKIWPEMVAEFLDMDLINVSEGGAGNDYIYGQTLDAIEENKDRDDGLDDKGDESRLLALGHCIVR